MPSDSAITFTYESPDGAHRIDFVRSDGSDIGPVFKDEVLLPSWAQNACGDRAPSGWR